MKIGTLTWLSLLYHFSFHELLLCLIFLRRSFENCQVWDRERPSLADYVLIDVGYAIAPAASSLTLGDVVCLSSPLVTENGELLACQLGHCLV